MGVLGFDEAIAVVLEQAEGMTPPAGERVELLDALGRTLAESVVADRDQPAFARSTRDGFAVTASALRSGVALRVIGEVRAGQRWAGAEPGAGDAVKIMTGAPLPRGTDAVAMVEFVEVMDGSVRGVAGRTLTAGDNVVPRGSEALAGETVLARGTRMGAAETALAAGCGCATLRVFRRPRVAIVATGDELVELGSGVEPGEAAIWNSNSYALAAMVTQAGGEAVRLRVARDLREEVRGRIAEGRAADLLILSGGVSVGDYDLVEEALGDAGAEFFFTGVRMQPGKPVVFGRLPERDGAGACFFFGLPGNPISTQVTFHCFVEPLLRGMTGTPPGGPRFVQATLAEEIAGKAGMMRLLPAWMTHRRERPEVRPIGWQGSGDTTANARANGYVVLPPREDIFRVGEVVSVLLR